MTDAEVLTAVQSASRKCPDGAVTVGQVAEALETSELDDVSTILERLHEAGKLGRGTGHATGPAVVTYTPPA